MSGEDPRVLGGPMVTAGGVRSDSMATPRQLDGYMHGVENDHESLTGEWHDTVESTTGSMGGESSKNVVVRVFVVKKEEGAGMNMCCGQIASTGSRFCTKRPSLCEYKIHKVKKAKVLIDHVYVGSGKTDSAWISWCVPVAVFGGKESQLGALNLTGAQFHRFGDTLNGLYLGGKGSIEMASVPWAPLIKEVTSNLDYGGTPRKVEFSIPSEGLFESTGLSNWMTFDTPGSRSGEEGADGSLDRSSETDYKMLETVTNLTVNAEVLKAAIEQLSGNQGKNASEFGNIIKSLGAQIHDVSVRRLGDNLGFVGSTQDSAWNGITLLHEEIAASRKMQSRMIDLEVSTKVGNLMKEQLAIDAFNRQADTRGYIQDAIEEDQRIRAVSDQRRDAHIHELQQKGLTLEAENASLRSDVDDLKAQMKSLPPSLSADWDLMFNFFKRNTKPSAPPVIAGGLLEDAVLNNSSSIKKLSTDLGQLAVASASGTGQSLSSLASGPSSTNPVASGPLATLTAQVLNLQERIASKAVTIEGTTFSTLKGTTQWVSANLPGSPEHALVCVDVVALLHSIGREYATTAETRESIYQNKRAGVSTMALTVASSFQTVLPQIIGKCSKTTSEDSGLKLPCASKFAEWSDNSEGLAIGVKPQIMDGLITQKAVYGEAIRELSYTHPVGAAIAKALLNRSYDFGIKILNTIDNMSTEYRSRGGEITLEEEWVVISGVIRQMFREFRTVRRAGAAAAPGSPGSIGATWWYVLQTHRIMDEFDKVDIRKHPSIIPVFTSHLDRYRVTKTTHAALASQVKKLDTLLSSVSSKVDKINGARGNQGGGGRGGGGRGGGADDG
jgi:hypothetical protein